MAKKMGHEQTLSFGGTTINAAAGGCIIGTPTVGREADNAISNCAGVSHKKTYTGNEDTTLSFDVEFETDAVTLIGTTLELGTRGAVVYQPFGSTSGDVQLDATDAVVTAYNMSAPINGLVMASYTIKLTDWAVSAIP